MSETKAPADKGRTVKEVSKDMQNAGFNESPVPPAAAPPPEEKEPSFPEPKKLTPAEMAQDPDDALNVDEGAPNF